MNIFVLDYNPAKSATHMVDSHVMSKMIVESCQILSNCFTEDQLAHSLCPRTQKGTVRKHSYPHHPCCKWVQKSKFNMMWVINNAVAMHLERTDRWKTLYPDELYVEHFSMPFIYWCKENLESSNAPDAPPTQFVQCMPDQYKNIDPVVAYRNYYKYGKKDLHQWVLNKPSWIND